VDGLATRPAISIDSEPRYACAFRVLPPSEGRKDAGGDAGTTFMIPSSVRAFYETLAHMRVFLETLAHASGISDGRAHRF
jgi:hypothetical protein